VSEVTVASFNTRWGRDARGRPIDVGAVVERLDADVVVLQETWRPDGEEGMAASLGALLGYQVFELPLARGSLVGYLDPLVRTGRHQVPARTAERLRRRSLRSRASFGAPGGRPGPEGQYGKLREGTAMAGDWGVAVLCRLSVRSRSDVELGQLPLDRARRGALVVELDVGGTPFVVVGTHLAHLTHGSLVQLRGLRRSLPGLDQAAALAGDMNLWGPVVRSLLPGWRRAVLGRTWPARHPHSQIDHVLVTPQVQVVGGEVLGDVGSDHRPVRAELRVA
jgi:endonuclease/exonuclease/phosphatase family metal-dependent hydrolase